MLEGTRVNVSSRVLGALCLTGLWLGSAVACGGTVTHLDPEEDDGSDSSASSSGGSGDSDGGAGGTRSSSSSSSSNSSSSSSGSSGTGGSSASTRGSTSASSDGAATSSTDGSVSSSSSSVGGASSVTVVTGGSVSSGGAVFGSTNGAGGGTPVDYGDIPIPEDCLTDFRSESSNWCELSLSCSNNYVYSYCDGSGEVWNCGCDTSYFYSSYELNGVESPNACPTAASLCLDPDQVEFTDPPVCTPLYNERSSGYCSTELECTQSQRISDQVTAKMSQWQYIYCYDESGTWRCECDGNGGYVSIQIAGVEDEAALCSDMLDVCNSGDIEPEGPRACSLQFQSASQGYCDSQQECTQQASVDGMEVLVNSYITTSCREASDGEWDCNCQTAPGNTSFTINGTDAWTTCEEASDACAVAAGAE